MMFLLVKYFSGSIRQKRDLTRSSRRARHHVEDEISTSQSEVSRIKRSAVWFLSAAVRLCDSYPKLCTSIELHEKDMHLTIRLEDM
jgi:hypothetical protein